MPSLLDLRRRIHTVANTQKITKAMELVAASKLRRAQERMQNARPYADELSGVMAQLMGRTSGYQQQQRCAGRGGDHRASRPGHHAPAAP
jgi:F-type H+-transporting ATPase subunit gamma